MKIVMGADQYPDYTNGAATFTAGLAAGLAGAPLAQHELAMAS